MQEHTMCVIGDGGAEHVGVTRSTLYHEVSYKSLTIIMSVRVTTTTPYHSQQPTPQKVIAYGIAVCTFGMRLPFGESGL
jgi:hypothetical protein